MVTSEKDMSSAPIPYSNHTYSLRMTRRRLLFNEETMQKETTSHPQENESLKDDDSDDPDYIPSDSEAESESIPSEDEDDIDSEDDSEYDEEEDNIMDHIDIASLARRYRTRTKLSYRESCENSDTDSEKEQMVGIMPIPTKALEEMMTISTKKQRIQQKNTKYKDLIQKMSPEEKTYFLSVSEEERETLFSKYKQIIEKEQEKTPLRFRILTSPMPDATKRIILQKLDIFQSMNDASGEYHKYSQWIYNVSRLPIGKYNAIHVDPSNITSMLIRTRIALDDIVYGHMDAKDHIMRVLAQWIINPSAQGHCIGIQGPMGIGKTTLIKEGVSRALNIPFGFIALGGASDASFLEGHSFTYEGSTYGRIAEILMKTQVMNPILFFDELDKLSDTPRGDEISSLLTHLTDISQNDRFTDKYFGDIELDLSKALIIFSFNDETKINPILKDRMTVIRVKGYELENKIQIARNYLLPLILKQYQFPPDALHITDGILKKIVELLPSEQGVRHLRRGIESIVSWANMARYINVPPFTSTITLPYEVDESHLPIFMKTLLTPNDGPPSFMYT